MQDESNSTSRTKCYELVWPVFPVVRVAAVALLAAFVPVVDDAGAIFPADAACDGVLDVADGPLLAADDDVDCEVLV